VVIHDGTVDRTTNGTGRVAALPLEALQALDAGHCATPGEGSGTARRGRCRQEPATRFPFRGRGARIPTLDEVLRELPAGTFLSVEVKDGSPETVVAVTTRLAAERGRLRLVVGARDAEAGDALARGLPEALHYFSEDAARCLALAAKARAGFVDCPRFDVLAVPPSVYGLDLTSAGVIAGVHRRGAAIVYWTVNDEPTLRRIRASGADGVITDYPGRARALWAGTDPPAR
jgi:glycerophosphoryl diester phosphodiesterase